MFQPIFSKHWVAVYILFTRPGLPLFSFMEEGKDHRPWIPETEIGLGKDTWKNGLGSALLLLSSVL